MTNFLTTPLADPTIDALRNRARLDALRSLRAERKLAASHGTTADLEAAEKVAIEADESFAIFRDATLAA